MTRTADATTRRRTIDPRLLIGLVLVGASVAGVVALVTTIDTRETVYAAAGSLTPGERIAPDDLVERSVALDGADELYLRVGDIPEEGLIVMQPVRKGELLPRSAVSDEAGSTSTSVVLQLGGQVSAAVVAGAWIDVWASPSDPESRELGVPAVLVADAVVVRLVQDDGLVSSARTSAIEVLVPRAAIARILQAQAAGDVLAVVPAGLPLGA